MVKGINKESQQSLWGFPRPEITWMVMANVLIYQSIAIKFYSQNSSSMSPYFETLIGNFEVENETKVVMAKSKVLVNQSAATKFYSQKGSSMPPLTLKL